jgi:hypothetical protein
MDKYRWVCVKECLIPYTSRSIRVGSIFENSRIELKRLIHALYLWSQEVDQKVVIDTTGISKTSAILLFKTLRDICRNYLIKNPIQLGGPGIICQIDESCFSHRPKHHRGRSPAHEKWVFGIVDTSYYPARGYLQLVPDRKTETLLQIITNICRSGTIIWSDEWPSYKALNSRGWDHGTVNHSISFVCPETGVHTQNIESFWAKQKYRIKQRKGILQENLQDYLYEFMWREIFKENAYIGILSSIKIEYDF